MPARRPQTGNRLLCPGEVQPSGHLRLQESRHLERLEPPGRRLHTQQGCVCFTTSCTQNVFPVYFISILFKSQCCFLSWPRGFLIINLSSAIRVRKTMSVCPLNILGWQIQTACEPGPGRHQWAARLDRDLPARVKNWNESGCRPPKIDQVKTLFVQKLWVEAGLRTDDVSRGRKMLPSLFQLYFFQ